jgi:dTDP-4-dehydrorhamnose reductase
MTRRVIFGNGKVSRIIRKESDIVVTRQTCDITDFQSVLRVFREYSPEVVINCAAKTNLEWCQENKEETFKANTLGPINLLKACADLTGAKLVHISSGCLFDGNDMLSTEKSTPTPAVWYTWTKVWADQYIQNFGYENYLILRPRQLISAVSHPSNMLTKFASFNRLGGIEEDNSVTCIEDFSDMIDHLLEKNETGIFNCCNAGTLTPYEIACEVRDHISTELEVVRMSYEDLLEQLPNRRVNTILSIEKLKSTGYTPRSARSALMWCLENYSE